MSVNLSRSGDQNGQKQTQVENVDFKKKIKIKFSDSAFILSNYAPRKISTKFESVFGQTRFEMMMLDVSRCIDTRCQHCHADSHRYKSVL